jgi:hypothetical protein
MTFIRIRRGSGGEQNGKERLHLFPTCALFCNGVFVTNEQMNEVEFLKPAAR